MNWLRRLAIAFGLLIVLPIAGLSLYRWWYYPIVAVHVELTLSVKDGDEIKTASSVVEFSEGINGTSGTFELQYGFRTRGEGIFLNLSKGRNAVLLLTSYVHDANRRQVTILRPLLQAFAAELANLPEVRIRGAPAPSVAARMRQLQGRKKRLALFGGNVVLATVADTRDGKSARVFEPKSIGNVLGSDVSLVGIFAEITDRPITRGKLEQALPFLKQGLWVRHYPLDRSIPDIREYKY